MICNEKLSKAERLDLFSRGYRVAIVREHPDGVWRVHSRHRSVRNGWRTYAHSPMVHDIKFAVVELSLTPL